MSIFILEEAEGPGRDGGGSSQSPCFKAQMCLGETLAFFRHSTGEAGASDGEGGLSCTVRA